MNEAEWKRVQNTGQQARHQAAQIVRRAPASWERGDPWAASWRRWAIFVLMMDTDPSRECTRRPAPGGADFQITPPR